MVFDSQTEQLSEEELSVSSERIFKDRPAWRGSSLLTVERVVIQVILAEENNAASSPF